MERWSEEACKDADNKDLVSNRHDSSKKEETPEGEEISVGAAELMMMMMSKYISGIHPYRQLCKVS